MKKNKRGLIILKALPFHMGHVALINFAKDYSNDIEICVLLCTHKDESIDGIIRFNWINDYFKDEKRITPIHFEYNKRKLPATSVSSRKTSYLWSMAIKEQFGDFTHVFSSEPYGEFVAEYLNAKSVTFDIDRKNVQISATLIRKNPYLSWDFLPQQVRDYYFKKVTILGTESTGKSTLTQDLVNHFKCDSVSEVGREIVEQSDNCTFKDLELISRKHAENILSKEINKNKLLIIDSNIYITKSYADFLFKKDLNVSTDILKANQSDIYLYLNNDVPFVQDGTRLSEEDRNNLNKSHLKQLKKAGIKYHLISGNWEERFNKAVEIILENRK